MKIKNLFVSLLLMLICAGSAFAGNKLANDGYVGNVAVSVTPQIGFGVDITTSHGYSFGNGLWMGGGAGVSIAGGYYYPDVKCFGSKYNIEERMKHCIM